MLINTLKEDEDLLSQLILLTYHFNLDIERDVLWKLYDIIELEEKVSGFLKPYLNEKKCEIVRHIFKTKGKAYANDIEEVLKPC